MLLLTSARARRNRGGRGGAILVMPNVGTRTLIIDWMEPGVVGQGMRLDGRVLSGEYTRGRRGQASMGHGCKACYDTPLDGY